MSDQHGDRRQQSGFPRFRHRPPSGSFEDDDDDVDKTAFMSGAAGAGDGFPFSRNAPVFGSQTLPPGFRAPRAFSERFSDMGNFPEGDGGSGATANVCGNSNVFRERDRIPIPVVHSKPSRHKYDGGNTTHLPSTTKQPPPPSPSPSPSSPRIERARSEPPKFFNAKLKTKPFGKQQQQPIQEEAHAVRRIPIFVEGRDEPFVGRRDVTRGAATTVHGDDVTGGTTTVRGDDVTGGTTTVHGDDVTAEARDDVSDGRLGAPNNGAEPSSPLSPPPGPIPMGYSPMGVGAKEYEACESKKAKVADPAMEKLQLIWDAVEQLSKQIGAFKGEKSSKEYLYLDEMLTRHLLSLDCVEAAGRDDVRQMRRDAIRSINRCLSNLDANARSGETTNNDAIIDELVEKSRAE